MIIKFRYHLLGNPINVTATIIITVSSDTTDSCFSIANQMIDSFWQGPFQLVKFESQSQTDIVE